MTQSPKRICIDARFYAKKHAGLSRYTQALIHHLMKLDHEAEYTVILRSEAEAEYPKDTPHNWHVKILDIVHYSVAEQTTFLGYLNAQKFDLVYFTMFNHPLFYRGKSVVMIHDLIMHMYPPRPLWHPRTWAYRFLMWHAAHWSDAIINNSETTKKDVVKYLKVKPEKCHVTLLAVEDYFKPATDEQIERVKAKYKITQPYIFFVNAWRPHKGLPELVEAFININRPDLQLVIGGKPNNSFPDVKNCVEDALQTHKNIVTTGFIDDEDLPVLYAGAEIYVNPSHYEGFGFGVLEGMACGTPTIAADNACLKEVGGDAALYFETKSADDLTEVLVKLLNNKEGQKALVTKGLDRVKAFSFDRMAEQTRNVFNKVLDS